MMIKQEFNKTYRYVYNILLFKTYAGVLIYTLVISILTLIFLVSFLQMFMFSNQGKLKLITDDKKEDYLQSGLEYLLSANFNCCDTIFKITLFEDNKVENILKQEQYGLFNILTSRLVWREDTINKSILTANCRKLNQTCLILGENSFSLKLGGNALLEGDIEISEKGIEKAYIGGKNYCRDSLVYGNIKFIKQPIPKLSNEFEKINSNNIINYAHCDIQTYSSETIMNINNTFNHKLLLISSKNEINICIDSIKGKCVVKSDKLITIGKNAFLENVILNAPKIIVEDNFTGCVQLIANDTIILGKNVELQYPSTIFVKQDKVSIANPFVEIGDNTKIQGMIIIIQNESVMQKLPVLTVGIKAKITGQIYTSGNVYHRGEIYGSLICKQFVDLSSGVNENLLIDGIINKRKMPSFFPEFGIAGTVNKKKLLKCLY